MFEKVFEKFIDMFDDVRFINVRLFWKKEIGYDNFIEAIGDVAKDLSKYNTILHKEENRIIAINKTSDLIYVDIHVAESAWKINKDYIIKWRKIVAYSEEV